MGLSAIKNIPIGTYLAKAVGVGAGLLVLYDAHSHGKIKATMNEQNVKSDSLETSFMNNLSYDSPSVVRNDLRDKMFAWKADENVTPFFSRVKGYISGFGEMLLRDILPLTLAVGAVISPTKHGFLSKGFGIGLLVYGAGFFIHNFLGIGQKR